MNVWEEYWPLLLSAGQALLLTVIVRLNGLLRRDMKNGITHQKTVYTTPREEIARTESITHARRPAPRPFDLDGLDAEEVTHFIRVVARHGDLAGLTLTSDGGALVLSIVQGSIKHKAYASTPEAALLVIHDMLQEVY